MKTSGHRRLSGGDERRNTLSRPAFLKNVTTSSVGVMASPLVPSLLNADTTTVDPGLFATIYSLRSMRRLKPDPIPEETLKKIIDAGIHAPNGGNRQDRAFILVRDPDLKRFIRDRYWEHFQKVQAGATPFTDMPPATASGCSKPRPIWPSICTKCPSFCCPAWQNATRTGRT
jgi:hypothetical protein